MQVKDNFSLLAQRTWDQKEKEEFEKRQREQIKLIVESLFHSTEFQNYRNQIKNVIYSNAQLLSNGVHKINEYIENDDAPYRKYYKEEDGLTGQGILNTLQEEYNFYRPKNKKLIKPTIIDTNSIQTPHFLQNTQSQFTNTFSKSILKLPKVGEKIQFLKRSASQSTQKQVQ